MSAAANALLYEEPGKIPSAVLAVLVHVLLAVFLFFGVHWQSREPEAVTVELWNSLPTQVAERVEPSPVVKPEPIPEPEPVPKPEIKQEPKVEKTVEPHKPDIALDKKKEIKKEIPKKAEPAPKKPEPKPKIDRSKDFRAQVEREITDVRKNLETDRLTDLAQREAATSAAATADAAYVGKLKGKIKSNVVLPPNIAGNPEAIFDVVQLPTGEVMSAKLRKSSGFQAYDAAVERAILKSSPLPRPDRPEQFQRNLEIKFRPQE